MSSKVEKLEKNMAKFTIEVPFEEFNKFVDESYNKQKGSISVPGFRKGKVPRKMIEKMYGENIFFEEAMNLCLPEYYGKALEENKDIEVVSRPTIDVVQCENNKPFIFTAEVAVKPEVELGEYKGVKIPKISNRVTAKEIDSALEDERKKNARKVKVTDRAVKDGDDVLLDFDGYVDDKPFDGGKADNYPLTIGSGAFIPGFEEQLVGMNIGETKDVKVKFPKDYQAKELADKDAVFKCKINEISEKELPELNDEFADEASEFETLEAWKADIKAKIKQTKEANAKAEREDKAIESLINNSKMDIPDPMIALQVEQMMSDYAMRMQQQGISMEQYMQFTGITKEKMAEEMRPQALKRIQSSLVLEEVATKENIIIDDAKLDKEMEEMAKTYNMDKDKLKSLMGETEIEQMKKDMLVSEAMKFVIDNAVEE